MNKKRWTILIVVFVLIAVVAGLGGWLANSANQGGKSEEPSAEKLFPKIQDIAGAPKINCVGVGGKIELVAQVNKEHWENLGALSVEVKVENIIEPERVLLSAVLTQTIFDKSGVPIGLEGTRAADIPQLKPGEVKTINLDMISANVANIGGVKLAIRDDYKFAESTVSPPPVNPPTAETNVYTTAPKNPKTPEEVLAAFYFLVNDEKYLEAAKLIEQAESLIKAGKITEGEITAELSKIFRGGELVSIRVERPATFTDKAGVETAYTSLTLCFKDREEYISPDLVKENGEWRIRGSNF